MKKLGKFTVLIALMLTLFGVGFTLSTRNTVDAATTIKYIDFEIEKSDLVLQEIETVGTQTKYRVTGFSEQFKNTVKTNIDSKDEDGVTYYAHLIFPNILTQSSNIQVITEFGYANLNQYSSATDLFNGFVGSVGKITFPSYLAKVNPYSVYLLYNLREVNFAASQVLTEIGDFAFYSCNRLNTISTYSGASKRLDTTFPYSLQSIGSNAFASCSKITELKFTEAVNIGQSAFYNCQSIETLIFGDADIKLGMSSFKGDISLKNIVLPNNLDVVQEQSFMGCTNLESVVFPKALVKVGNSAFANCYKLGNLDFNKSTSLNEIGESAFENCFALQSFTFPASITKLGVNAFKMTVNTADISTDNDEAKLEKIVFAEGSFGMINDTLCDTDAEIGTLNLADLDDTFNSVKYFLYHKNYKNSFTGSVSKSIMNQLSTAYPTAQFIMYPVEIVYKNYNYADDEFVVNTDPSSAKWLVYNNTNLISNEVMPGDILSEIYFPDMPVRVGYDFIGWHTTPNPTDDSTKVGADFVVPTNCTNNTITLYAVYDLKEFTLKMQDLEYSNGTWKEGDVYFTSNTLYGDELTREEFVADCITRKVFGLYTNKALTQLLDDITITSDLTLYSPKFTSEVYNYALNNDNTYTLTGSKILLANVIVPNTYKGLPVIAIKDNAFNGNKNIIGLITESTNSNLKSIGAYAFANTSMTTAILPASCIELKQMAFSGVENDLFATGFAFKNIDIEIMENAIPENAVIGISNQDYNDTTKLATWKSKFASTVSIDKVNNKVVTVHYNEPASILSGNTKYADSVIINVFPGETFELPKINKTGYEFVNAVSNAETYEVFVSTYDELNISDITLNYEFIYNIEADTNYLFVITGIKDAYNHYEYLEIPAGYSIHNYSIKAIGENAFKGNDVIKEVLLSDKITLIGESAFANSKIEKVTFAEGSGLYDLASSTTNPLGFTIGVNAFADSLLKEIDFSNLTTFKFVVSDGAFKNCENLNSVDFTKLTLEIKYYDGTIDVEIPSQNIDLNAFNGSNISTIKLYSIGDVTFPVNGTVTKLANVVIEEFTYIRDMNSYVNNGGAVYNADLTELLFIPDALSTDFVLPNETTKLYDNAFMYTSALKSVVLNENVQNVYKVVNGAVYKVIDGSFYLWHVPAGLNVTEFVVESHVSNIQVINIATNALRYNHHIKAIKFADNFVSVLDYQGTEMLMLNNEMYGNFECIYLKPYIHSFVKGNFANVPTLRTVVLEYAEDDLPNFIDKTSTDTLKDYFGQNVTSIIVPQGQEDQYNSLWTDNGVVSASVVVKLTTNMGEDMPSISLAVGEKPTLTAPTKKGYDFIGWYLDEECTTPYNNEAIYSDTTLYGKLTLHKYTVTYMVDDNVFTTEEVVFGVKTKGPESTPTKKGYVFDCWVDEKGDKYDVTEKVESDIVLKAKFLRDKDYLTKQIIIYSCIALAVILVLVITIVLVKKHKEKQMLRNPNKQKKTKQKKTKEKKVKENKTQKDNK